MEGDEGDDPVMTEEPEVTEDLALTGEGFTLVVGADQITIQIPGEEDVQVPLLRTNNHGAYVSAVAKAGIKGRMHGKIVSLIAQSDLGKVPTDTEEEVDVNEPVDSGDPPDTVTPAPVEPEDGPVVAKADKKAGESSGKAKVKVKAKVKAAKGAAKGNRK